MLGWRKVASVHGSLRPRNRLTHPSQAYLNKGLLIIDLMLENASGILEQNKKCASCKEKKKEI
jgi:hypothetical protein